MILHFILCKFERAGSDGRKGELAVVVGILRYDGLGSHGQEIGAALFQVNDQRLVILCLIGLDIVESVQAAVNGQLNGIQYIVHGQRLTVVELHAVPKNEGVDLRVVRYCIGLCDRRLEGSL